MTAIPEVKDNASYIYHEVWLALLHQPLAVSIYLKIYRIT
jgi:hypothetical protein